MHRRGKSILNLEVPFCFDLSKLAYFIRAQSKSKNLLVQIKPVYPRFSFNFNSEIHIIQSKDTPN
jgi:hypothetical protein